MELKPLDSIKPARELSLWDVLDVIARLLELGYVDECIRVDGDNRVTRGLELYWALYRIGVKLAPVGDGGCLVRLEDLGFFDDVRGEVARVYSDTLELATRDKPTPMVMLRSYSGDNVRVWAKLEWFNPFSLSVKDRPVIHIVSELSKRLNLEGRILADASSANFGIALAAVAPRFRAKARIYIPMGVELFGKIIPRIMEAEVVETKAELTVEILSRIRDDATREGLIHVNQFTNDLNFESHLRTTAKEIEYQARMKGLNVKAIAGSLGTSGHMAAVSFYAKRRLGGDIRIIAAQPAQGHRIPGMRRRETGMIWLTMIAEDYEVYDVTLEEAVEAIMRVARGDGILIGPSGGAALKALEKAMREKPLEGDVVVVIPDTGFKYVSLLSKTMGG